MNLVEFFNAIKERNICIWNENDKLKAFMPKGIELSPSEKELIDEKKPEILKTLKNNNIFSKEDFLHRRIYKNLNESGNWELSFAQERLWFVEQFQGGSSAYNIPMAFELGRDANLDAFKKSIVSVTERHEVLRTVFRKDEYGNDYQFVMSSKILISEERIAENDLPGRLKTCINSVFNLVSEGPLKVYLFITDISVYALIIVHHIAFDGWSEGIFISELQKFYLHYKDNRELQLSTPDIQYKDFAIWQKAYLSGETLEKYLNYWKENVKGYETMEFPTDIPRPSRADYRGDKIGFELSEELSGKLKKLASDKGVTLFTVLLSAFYVLLNRYTGQENLIVGTPIANRNYSQLESLIGFFVNSLALKAKTAWDMTFDTLIKDVNDNLAEAQNYQDLPFEKLVDALKIEHDMSRHPVFQIMFGLIGFGNQEDRLFRNVPLDEYYKPAKFDLSLYIEDTGTCLKGILNYAVSLFNVETIERLRKHYVKILEQVAANSSCMLGDITILTEEEFNKIVYDWNETDEKFPVEKTIVKVFEEQAEKTPDRIAVIFKDQKLTYRELNERANKLAHTIRRDYREYTGMEITGDTLIGLYIDRNLETITAILGILKSGAAYVPFDLADPEERLRFKINDCGCRMILTSTDSLKNLVFLTEIDTLPLSLDSYQNEIEEASKENPVPINKPYDLAYIIYTSGSTGRPKGVMISHSNVIRLFLACNRDYSFSENDVWSFFHSYAFDFSVWEIWGALLYGGCLVVVPYPVSRDPDQFVSLVNKDGVTVLSQTPSAFYNFMDADQRSNVKNTSLRYVVYGGEALDINKLKTWWEKYDPGSPELINMYGITETTVHTTFKALSPKDFLKEGPYSPIGKRLDDLTVYLLDNKLRPVPPGVPGELFVGGAGVARGYFNRPELTHERFIENPFATEKDKVLNFNERLYKSGDLAQWNEDGSLYYIGRNDFQVKIRGFRIELGEIEAKITAIPAVSLCMVKVYEREDNKYLVAYYTVTKAITVDEITEYLSGVLPIYMIPSYFIELDKFPLNTSGKIDRKALPEPSFKADESHYEPPRNEFEEELCRLWQEELGVEKVGINDDFFRLGGNSILAIKLSHKMTKELQREIPIASLFDLKTVRGISEALAGFKRLVTIEPYKGDKAILSFAQERLYFIEEYEGGSNAYNIPLFFRLNIDVDLPALKKSIQSIAERHEILRTIFVRGEGGEIYQKTLSKPVEIIELDVRDIDGKVKEAVNVIFDLHNGYPIKIHLYHKGEICYLLINVHHIAFDGWSTDIFLRELSSFYHHYKDGNALILPELDIQYRDFAVWQREYLKGDRLQEELDHWKNELDGYEPLEFPLDKTRPSDFHYEGDYFLFDFDSDFSNKLRLAVKNYGTTPYTVFLSAFFILLHKYSGQNDILIGTPTANRHYSQLENLIGFFVNSTVMRCKITPELRIKDLIENVASMQAAMQMHQDLPFEKLIELLDVKKDSSRHPLFQIMFSVQSFGEMDNSDAKSLLQPVDASGSYKVAKFDMSLFINDSQDKISGGFNYAVSLFEKTTIARISRHYKNVLKSIVSGDNRVISDVELLSSAEYNQIVYNLNETYSPYPREKTIIEIFEEQVKKNPESIALEFGNERLTYRELNLRANKLAHTIRRDYREYVGEGIEPDTLIGIYIERSIDMVVGILGILKSGGAYVPFDRADPEERLKFKINDCGCRMILTSSECVKDLVFLTELDTLPLTMDEYRDEIENQPDANPERINSATDLAYVIYTSGSTGKPKGVMLEHYGVINLVNSHRQSFNIDSSWNILQFAPMSFDASVSTMFSTFLNGAGLYLCSEEDRKDVNKLSEFIVKNKISMIDIPAKLFELLPKDLDVSALRHVITAGEVCDKRTMDYWCDKVNVINAYGPTESTVCTTYATYSPDKSNHNIGKPIKNKKVYVLDSGGNPVPFGVPGELYIGGDGLARGYLNRPEITKERFVTNRFLNEGEEKKCEHRMYKTGDIVRWLRNGSLEFIGRNDDQVKVHGFRIELGEIESKLSSLTGIIMCAVKVYEREGNKNLAAYYTVSKEIAVDEIREYLSDVLPDYMMPSFFVRLEEFPLNTSGKIDRKALPDPKVAVDDEVYVAPRTDLEKQLCIAFQEVLRIEKVGINDDFFHIGGDSILSIQLCNNLKNAGIHCVVKDIFKNSAVEKLAEYINECGKEKVEVEAEQGLLSGEFELLPIQSWFFDKVKSGQFGKYNHWNQSFMLKVPELDVEKVKKCIQSLTVQHDILRATFTSGKQKYNKEIAIPDLKVLDRRALSNDELFEILTKWQSGFNTEQGPLWQFGYIYGYEDKSARLYFALHHLVVDAVSWRILIEDMKRSYEGEVLKEKTSSYRQWVNKMKRYPEKYPDERAYWENTIQFLPDYGRYVTGKTEPVRKDVKLDKEVTGQLIKEANGAYLTEINDLLLTALAYALKDWQGGNVQGITLEGHGRENIDPAIDHSHTVGWFTNIYPVQLALKEDISKSILSIKQSQRQIPNKGIGWGAFCCFTEEAKGLLNNGNLPPITFNYLGQLDGSSKEWTWKFANEPSGRSIDSANPDNSLIAINGIVVNEQLSFQVVTRLSDETTEKLTAKFKESLEEITKHCLEVKRKGLQISYNVEDFEYIPTILLNNNARSNKLMIMIHPDSGYQAYMATLYPALSRDIKVIMVDNFYKKVYLRDGVVFQKYHFKQFKDLAEYYVKLLLEEYKDLIKESDCSLVGYSFGCPVSYEMNRIFKEKSINVSCMYQIDPLMSNLLNTKHELDCMEWYKDYFPAPTTTEIAHFRCLLPDPSLPNYTEYFINPQESSLKSIAKGRLKEININCFHTAILNNAEFLNKFKEIANENLRIVSKKDVKEIKDSTENTIENQTKDILRQAIELDEKAEIDNEDNIFQLGCTSIQSLSVLAMINEHFRLNLALSDIMHDFTVTGLASSILKAQKSGQSDEVWKPVVFESKKSKADSLYFFPGLIGSVGSYNQICQILTNVFKVVFLEPKGMYGTMVPFATYEEAMLAYADEIAKREDKSATVYFAGHSIGSIHSTDVALLLEERGYNNINMINIDGYLYGIKSVKESLHTDNMDEALVGAIKIFFERGRESAHESAASKRDPLVEIAGILFPHENISRDHALRVALGYRNIWHQQLNEMLSYKKPLQRFNGDALLLLTRESGEEAQNRVLKSCSERYVREFKTVYISGDHLSCITQKNNIEEIYNYIIAWIDSSVKVMLS